MGGQKNRDLLYWVRDLEEIAEKHNEDKKALQEWRENIEEENEK